MYNIGCDEEFTNLEVAQKLVMAVKPGCADVRAIAHLASGYAVCSDRAGERNGQHARVQISGGGGIGLAACSVRSALGNWAYDPMFS